jgi:hypothetical protein
LYTIHLFFPTKDSLQGVRFPFNIKGEAKCGMENCQKGEISALFHSGYKGITSFFPGEDSSAAQPLALFVNRK